MVPPRPFTGSKPWALILCKFSNHPEEPQSVQFFRDFVTRGNHGINDYFNDVSYGNINLDGSDVFGWFSLPYTLETDQTRGRWDRVVSAINAVADSVDFRPFYGIAVMLNAPVDSGGFSGPGTLTLNGQTKAYGLVVLDNLAWGNTWAAQEMAHGYSLVHSWSADPDTEYGNPFDVMSAFTNNYGFTDSRFATSGPGMNAPNLDLFAWIPDSRIWQDSHSNIITLTALNRPGGSGYLMAKFYSGGKNYTIELRCKESWDAGIPEHAIVIHEVRSDGRNFVIRNGSRFYWKSGEVFVTEAPTFFNPSGEKIEIVNIDTVNCVATISLVQNEKSRLKDIVDGPPNKIFVKEFKEAVYEVFKQFGSEVFDPFKNFVIDPAYVIGVEKRLKETQEKLRTLEQQIQQKSPFIKHSDLPPVGIHIPAISQKGDKNDSDYQ